MLDLPGEVRVHGAEKVVPVIQEHLLENTMCPLLSSGNDKQPCWPNCVCFEFRCVPAFEHVPEFHRVHCKHFDKWIGPKIIVCHERCCGCEELRRPEEMATAGGKNNLCHKCCDAHPAWAERLEAQAP